VGTQIGATIALVNGSTALPARVKAQWWAAGNRLGPSDNHAG